KIKWLDNVSAFLDNKFRIPGTETRFGLDFLVGLIPGAGDMISFGVSSVLVLTMARYGASGRVIIQMLWNIFLDTVVGAIPILGDIFDLYYKSNRRNFNLLRAHYEEGKYSGSGKWIVVTVLLALIAMFIGLIWLVAKLVAFSWEQLGLLLG
ncbi:MAG: DUF4112 domain-containing protein, partial [Bacteroidota bacterium]